MCRHVYDDCNYVLLDDHGVAFDREACETSCSSLTSQELACLSAAACTDAGLNACFETTTPVDNVGEGGACHCTAEPGVSSLYGKFCSGTDDGCAGIGSTGELGCFAQRQSGTGTCVYRCSRSELGYQGGCPAGYSCQLGQYVDASDQNWPICVRF